MAKVPRLNSAIGALEQGGATFSAFVPMDIQTAQVMTATNYDSIVFTKQCFNMVSAQFPTCLGLG